MTTELRGYELDMYEWLKKHAPNDAVTFADILTDHSEPRAVSSAFVASVLDELSPDLSGDVRPIDFFREFRDGRLGEIDDSIRELSRGDLAELTRIVALRYACYLYAGDDRLGRQLLFFNAFHRVYNEVYSDSAVRRRETLAQDGWHNRLCVIYPDDKNPQALLNAYRQGQKAKHDGRECGCAACIENARRALEASTNHAGEQFEYKEMLRKQGFGAVTVTVGDPEPAFPVSDDEMPF